MKKVLVVEDNEKNMYLICYIIETMGHLPLKASTGEEGVALAAREQPDLILMDIQLPGIDGLEATERIRAARESASIPVIAVTSYAMTGDREKTIEAGCNGYIEKPINPDTFMRQVEEHLV